MYPISNRCRVIWYVKEHQKTQFVCQVTQQHLESWCVYPSIYSSVYTTHSLIQITWIPGLYHVTGAYACSDNTKLTCICDASQHQLSALIGQVWLAQVHLRNDCYGVHRYYNQSSHPLCTLRHCEWTVCEVLLHCSCWRFVCVNTPANQVMRQGLPAIYDLSIVCHSMPCILVLWTVSMNNATHFKYAWLVCY